MKKKCGKVSSYKTGQCTCAECHRRWYRWQVARGDRIPRLPVQPIYDAMTSQQRHDNRRWLYVRRDIGVRIYDADAMCISLGLHPMAIYGDLWLDDEWGMEFGDAA